MSKCLAVALPANLVLLAWRLRRLRETLGSRLSMLCPQQANREGFRGYWSSVIRTDQTVERPSKFGLSQTAFERILKSRRVVPTRLVESGFVFDYSNWPAAAAELCGRWRERGKP